MEDFGFSIELPKIPETLPDFQQAYVRSMDASIKRSVSAVYDECRMRMLACEPLGRPTAYLYARCSHRDSADSGRGLEVQHHAVERYFEEVVKPRWPHVVKGGWFVDAATSARSHEFATRKEGGKIMRKLKPHDHIIFYNVDRGWRRVKDMLTCIERWHRCGITVHFVDQSLDNHKTSYGKFMLIMQAAIAEWEAEKTSERNREITKRSAARGIPQKLSRYWRWAGKKGKRYPVPDKKNRQFGKRVYEWWISEKYTKDEMVHMARRLHKQMFGNKVAAERWTSDMVYRWYTTYKKHLQTEREGRLNAAAERARCIAELEMYKKGRDSMGRIPGYRKKYLDDDEVEEGSDDQEG